MSGRAIAWTRDELAWIEARAAQPRRALLAAFNAAFGRAVTLSALVGLCKRRGWMTGRDGRFAPGQTPPNKGRRMPFNAASAATRFKPGHRGGEALRKYCPIGTERMSKCGYREVKIHDGMPLQSRWRAVHLVAWEAVNGPVPSGHALKCLDGDRLNADPANWAAIPRAMLPRLNGRFGRGYDAAPAALKPTILRVAELEHAARRARRAGRP